jgi:hypothetical protein
MKEVRVKVHKTYDRLVISGILAAIQCLFVGKNPKFILGSLLIYLANLHMQRKTREIDDQPEPNLYAKFILSFLPFALRIGFTYNALLSPVREVINSKIDSDILRKTSTHLVLGATIGALNAARYDGDGYTALGQSAIFNIFKSSLYLTSSNYFEPMMKLGNFCDILLANHLCIFSTQLLSRYIDGGTIKFTDDGVGVSKEFEWLPDVLKTCFGCMPYSFCTSLSSTSVAAILKFSSSCEIGQFREAVSLILANTFAATTHSLLEK